MSSSSDEMSSGPPTVKEIKKHLLRPKYRKVHRRQTVEPILKYSNYKSEAEKKQEKQLIENMEHKCNVSSSYFTPDESEIVGRQKVISDVSNYLTAFEDSKITSETDFSDTLCNFVENARSRPTQVDIRNVNGSVLNDDSFLADVSAGTIENESILLTSNSEHFNSSEDEEIIIISDDEEEDNESDVHIVPALVPKSHIKQEKMSLNNLSLDNKDSAEYSLSDSSHNEYYNTSTSIRQSTEVQNDMLKINITSCDNETASPLNDTLEEIEKMLRSVNNKSHGESTASSDNSVEAIGKLNSAENNSTLNLQNPFNLQVPLQKKTEQRELVKSSSELRRSCIPRKLKSPVSFKTEKPFATTSKIPPTRQGFKVPITPSNKSIKTNIFPKNIVSPVAMYIKYSPKAVLTKSAIPTPLKNVKVSSYTQKVPVEKENVDNFPDVIYKPSKKQICTKEPQIHLPNSIDKMVTKANLVKHEKRLLKMPNENVIQKKLTNDSELTSSSISDSLLSESNVDISFWTSKQPFNN